MCFQYKHFEAKEKAGANHGKTGGISKAKINVIRTMIVITVCFVACLMPYDIYFLKRSLTVFIYLFSLPSMLARRAMLCLLIGPIPWGHSGPLCHALSFVVVVVGVVDIDVQAACDSTVATPGELA